MTLRIQFRRDTASNWTLANTLLAEGELALEIDTGKFKVGNGLDSWAALSYSSGPEGPQGPQGIVGPAIITTVNRLSIAGEIIVVDTTSNPVTITLPASPQNGEMITLIDNSDWSINNLTVARNGSTIEGYPEDIVIDRGAIKVEFVFDGIDWKVTNIGDYQWVLNDGITNAAFYPTMINHVSGKILDQTISSTKLSFNPSTGILSATGFDGNIEYSNLIDAPAIPSSLTDLGIAEGANGQILKTDGAGAYSWAAVTNILGYTPLSTAGGTITGTLVINGNITHNGLVASEGTGIDQVKTITKSITLTTDWQDVGINSTDLSTGTYIVQLVANDLGSGGSNINEYYSGTMSWYSGDTDSGVDMPTDEIILHRAGASREINNINYSNLYLRTFRTPTADTSNLKLQIYSNSANASSANYVFKFRRLI